MADDLKPCPFCGEKAIRCENFTGLAMFWTQCGSCHACPGGDHATREKADAAWNTRAQGPGEAVAKKTMCLTLTDEEMAALEEVIKAKDATPKTIFRSALKLFQLEVRGFATVNVDLAATPTREA